MSASDSFRAGFGRLSWLGKADAVALAASATLLTIVLWSIWTHDPDLAHGVLMPVVFFLLLRESREAGPPRFLRPGFASTAAVAILALAGLTALGAAGLYSAAAGWSNALVEFLLAAALTFFLGAGLVAFADERIRLLPFNWTSLVAVGLWPLASPIPPGTYSRLTLGLQLWVSTGVLDALQLLHVAAHRQGNIIELATGSVGVAEACSGVRSLVSCVFVAFFFSASLVRQPWSRTVVVVAAAPLALTMNFVRSLTLTLLVNGGVDIKGFWHDATGFAVLALTAALLAGLALGLGSARVARAASQPVSAAGRSAAENPIILGTALAFAAVLVAFYGFNLRPPEHNAPIPDLLAVLPAAPPGWTEKNVTDFGEDAIDLQTDILAEKVYTRGRAEDGMQITFYLAYWRPLQASVALVDSHTPDACWPGTGWLQRVTPYSVAGLAVAGRLLAPAESRLFTRDDARQYVWFWHLYDGRSIPYQNPYSLRQLARVAWHYGFRHDGDQMFISVASNRPWSDIADQPLLQEFFAHTRPLGL